MAIQDRLKEKKESLSERENRLIDQKRAFDERMDELTVEFTSRQDEIHQELSTKLRSLLDNITSVNELMANLKDREISRGKKTIDETLSQLINSLEKEINSLLDRLSQEKRIISDKVNESRATLIDDLKKMLDESVKKPLERSLTESQSQLSQSMTKVTEEIESFLIQEQEVVKHSVTSTFNTIETELNQLETATKDLTEMTGDVEASFEKLYHQIEGHLEGAETHLHDEIQSLESDSKKMHDHKMKQLNDTLNTLFSNVTQNINQLNEKIDASVKQFQNASLELRREQDERLSSQIEKMKESVKEDVSEKTIEIEKIVKEVRKQFREQVYDEMEQMINSFQSFQDVISTQIDEIITRLQNARVEMKSHLDKMLHQKLQALNQIGEHLELVIEKSLQQVMEMHVKTSSNLVSRLTQELDGQMKIFQSEAQDQAAKIMHQLNQQANESKKIHEDAITLLQHSTAQLKTLADDHGKELHAAVMTRLNDFKEKYATVKKNSLIEVKEAFSMHSHEILSVLHAIEQRAEGLTKNQVSHVQNQRQTFEQHLSREMSDIESRLKTIEQEAMNSVIHAINLSLTSLERTIMKSLEDSQELLQQQASVLNETVENLMSDQERTLNDWLSNVLQGLEQVHADLKALFKEMEEHLDVNLENGQELLDSIKRQRSTLLDLQKTTKQDVATQLDSIKRTVSTNLQEFINSLRDSIKTLEDVIQITASHDNENPIESS